jgi:hypothetical protein
MTDIRGEPIAWETDKGNGLIRYVTESRYQKFSHSIQRYYRPYNSAKPELRTLDKFKELFGELEDDPLERLRFFCSLAMNRQDWLDVEPFFDDVQNDAAQ